MINIIRHRFVHPYKARQRQNTILREALRGYASNQTSFPASLVLPIPFAIGVNERAVEMMLARLTYRPGKEILDIGHANATPSHRAMLLDLPGPRAITGLDLADPIYDTTPFYKKSIRTDITANNLEDHTFDVIWCISTLEHFGMDNSGYTDGFIRDAGHAGKALVEMVRILKPGGTLLLTVPYGRYEDWGWFVNYDAAHWHALLDVVRKDISLTEWFFRHTEKRGWHNVPSEELTYTSYYDQHNFGAAGMVAALITKK
jgi:SAM-dependent methyltransferase